MMNFSVTDKEFEKYHEQYLPLIMKLSYKYNVYAYTPEDLQQELRMVLQKCIKNFDKSKGTKFMTYYYSSCHYHIIKLRKKNINYEFLIKDTEFVVDKDTDVISKILDDKFKKHLVNLLDNIKHGEFIKLYYLFNISMTKIAKIERVHKSHISRCIKQGLKELRKILIEEGVINE